jgi:hypothetical protein
LAWPNHPLERMPARAGGSILGRTGNAMAGLELMTHPGSGRLGAPPPRHPGTVAQEVSTASVGEVSEMAKKKHKQQQLEAPVSSAAASREAEADPPPS